MTVGGRRAEPLARRAVILLLATLGGLLTAVAPSAGAAAGPVVPFEAPLRRALPTMVSESDAIDAIVALQAEVLLLVELDAFPTPVPSPLRAVHDASASFLVGLDRPALRNWLRGSDQDGFASLKILTNAGVTLGDRTVAVLQPLSEDAWQALADGARIGLPAVAYVAALDELNALAYAASSSGSGSGSGDPSGTTVAPVWAPNPTPEPTTVAPTIPVTAAPFVPAGTTPASPSTVSSGAPGPSATPAVVTPPASLPRTGIVMSAPASGGTAAQSPPSAAGDRTGSTVSGRSSATGERTTASTDRVTDDATATTTASEDRAAPADGSSTLRRLGSAVAALAAVAAVAAVLGARRRRRRAATTADDADAMLEAGRRLSSTVEHGELLSIVLGQTRSLLAAERAAYLVRIDQALHVQAIDPVDGPEADHAAAGLGTAASVARVADTGQTWRGELSGPGGDQAAVAVAVTAAGLVQGVLIAIRAAARPFGPAEQARIDRLAPLVGAALANASRHDALAALTLTDALTALANRRQLDRDLHTAANGGGNNGLIGFAMIDVDHFKSYNDTHGHPAGDALLRQLAEVLAANVRPGDVVYRYGGEEFAVLLPGADQAEAGEVAERVRRAVHDADLAGGDTQPNGRVTVSVGVAVGPPARAEALKGSADRSLYEAKHGGRDRVVVAAAPTTPTDG